MKETMCCWVCYLKDKLHTTTIDGVTGELIYKTINIIQL